MANQITQLRERIERRLSETKKPCNSYATEAAAEKATEKMAKSAEEYYGSDSLPYLVFFVPAMGRWVGAVQTSAAFIKGCGGYAGFCCDKGFYTY